MKLGNTIRRLRKDRNLSLSDISKASGVQLATLSRIEHDKMTGTVLSHLGLSRALGLKLSELYQLHEIPKFRGHVPNFSNLIALICADVLAHFVLA